MFKNLKIGAKLGLGFGLVLALFAAVGIYAVSQVRAINNTIDVVVKDRMVKVRQTSDLVDNTNIVARGIRNLLLLQDSTKYKQEMERIETCIAANSKLFDSLEATITGEEGKRVLAKTMETRKAYSESRTEMFKLIEQGKKQEATTLLFGKLREAQAAFIQSNDDLITLQQNMAMQDGEAVGAAASFLQRMLIAVILATILASALIAWLLSRSITGPISQCSSLLDRIARGEVPEPVEQTFSGELETIRKSLNNCIHGLQGLVETEQVLQRMAVNNYTTEVKGSYQGIFARVGEATNLAQSRTTNAIRVINNIAVGNFAKDLVDLRTVGKRSEQDTLMPAYILAMESIQSLVADAELLSRAAVEGRLSVRADASKHQGDFRKIVQGVNDTLDAVIGPVQEAAAVLDKMAARDMTARVMGNYQGDHAKIKDALNLAVDNLEKALSQVADSTGQVSSASQQIAGGSQNLAQGANEQASSLEEVSASLEEMASMTRQNADNALAAKNLAGDAEGDTRQGLAAMNRMSGAIGKIKESSDQTAKIVKTIDEIAMQTNLLALNAAVEAARAGEAGRGFAVVAEEVRNLAQRSAQAAKNTADMIAESVRNADDGVGIVTSVAQSLDKIAGGVKKVNDLIGEIAAASKEQSQGIKEVTEAVTQMDKVTQQNAANAEESASASEELSSQAEELQSMVAQFRIRSTGQVVAGGQPLQGRKPAAIAHAPARNGKLEKPGVHLVHASQVIPLDNDVLKEF